MQVEIGTVEIKDLITVGTIVFAAGGLYWKLNSLGKRYDHLEELRNDDRQQINEHETRLAVLETKIDNMTGWMRDMRNKITSIYEKMLEK